MNVIALHKKNQAKWHLFCRNVLFRRCFQAKHFTEVCSMIKRTESLFVFLSVDGGNGGQEPKV